MIETFVFFDLETTGLPRQNIMPKITELSMVAVKRNFICPSTTNLPRIMCKLLMPINPIMDISPCSQAITKLYNNDFQNIKPFSSETYDLCMNFLRQLPQPVCFVAYNGNRFDYPIFLQELENINKTFSEEILSIDMLLFMREHFKGKNAKDKTSVMVKEDSHSVSCNSEEVDMLLNDGWDDALAETLDSVMTRVFNSAEPIDYNNSSNGALNDSGVIDGVATVSGDFKERQPRNFKLSTICEHILGSVPADMHSAEVDCLAMIRCACQLGEVFIDWADRFAVPFVHYKNKRS